MYELCLALGCQNIQQQGFVSLLPDEDTLHGLAEQVGREEGVEGGGPVVLVVSRAPDTAAQSAAGATPHVGAARRGPGVHRLAGAAGRVGGEGGGSRLLLPAAARL